MDRNLTIAALLEQGTATLQAAGSDSAHLDAQLLLAEALSLTRTQLRTHPEVAPDSGGIRRYQASLERRAAGEPIAYIVGYRDFWALRLAVNPSVLVPRPETELLVERTLAVGSTDTRLLDLGTGSGAIALALASERPQWRVTAVDASKPALQTASSNAAALGLMHVEFLHGHWFEPIAGQRFDVIVSNPPYIAENDPVLQDASLAHEPQDAWRQGRTVLATSGRSCDQPRITCNTRGGCFWNMAMTRQRPFSMRLWDAASVTYARTATWQATNASPKRNGGSPDRRLHS